jgi:hypothetical protein
VRDYLRRLRAFLGWRYVALVLVGLLALSLYINLNLLAYIATGMP